MQHSTVRVSDSVVERQISLCITEVCEKDEEREKCGGDVPSQGVVGQKGT